MSLLWPIRSDTINDEDGNPHPISARPYNNLTGDCQSGEPCGPVGHFGVRAEIGKTKQELINVWLRCDEPLWDYLTGEGAKDLPRERERAKARRNEVFEDFMARVKIAYRSGQLLPGDEVHVKLSPDGKVPSFGPEWRRTLRED